MNYATVKELLTKHFGLPRDSLTLGKERKQGGKNACCPRREYFYSLENEKETGEICALLTESFAKGGVKLPELTQSFPQKSQRDTCPPQCAQLSEQDGGGWSFAIYEIAGVTYHRTLGGKAAATLRLGKSPLVTLSDASSDFYGYFETSLFSRRHTPPTQRKGFSYWVNKALKTSDRFREFSADFFSAAVEEEGRGILRDVATAIRRCGCFLPPVSYGELLTCRTTADLLRRFSAGNTPLVFPFDSLDLNIGYVMRMLAPVVEPRDLEHLALLDAKTVSDAITLPLFYETFRADVFLSEYYKSTFARLGMPTSWAEEYVRLCEKAGAKPRIGCGRSAFENHLRELKNNRSQMRAADSEKEG